VEFRLLNTRKQPMLSSVRECLSRPHIPLRLMRLRDIQGGLNDRRSGHNRSHGIRLSSIRVGGPIKVIQAISNTRNNNRAVRTLVSSIFFALERNTWYSGQGAHAAATHA
jgi:hypothetical protein